MLGLKLIHVSKRGPRRGASLAILLFHYFLNFSALSKCCLPIECHVCIWQVSPQLSCVDICQIWMWCKEYNRYFYQIKLEKLTDGAFETQDSKITYFGENWLVSTYYFISSVIQQMSNFIWHNNYFSYFPQVVINSSKLSYKFQSAVSFTPMWWWIWPRPSVQLAYWWCQICNQLHDAVVCSQCPLPLWLIT